MGALLFDKVDDKVKSTSLGSGLSNLSAGNVGTLLWLFKAPAADATFDGLGYLLSGAGDGTAQFGLSINASEIMQMDLPNSRTAGSGFATNVFMFLVSKPAGSPVTARAHFKTASGGAWTHANFSGTENFATAASMLELGAWQNGDFFGGHMGVFAAWAANFSDADAEECDNLWRTSDLYLHSAGTPVSLIELNTLTPTDIGSSGAASISVTGTTVDSETLDGWTFDGVGGAAPSYPTAREIGKRGAFPFMPMAYTRMGTAARPGNQRESSGPSPMGGFERFVFPRLHPILGAAAYELDASPGTYALTGVAATNVADRIVDAAPATYAVTGVAATTAHGFVIDAAPATYAVTGSAASVLKASVVSANPGSYTTTGSAATVGRAISLNAAPAAYAVTGVAASTVKGSVVSANAGSYAVTGSAATTAAGRTFNAAPGSYILTGVATTLEVGTPGAYVLQANTGSYAVAGAAMTPLSTRVLNAAPAAYLLTGSPMTAGRELNLNAVAGSYTLTGVAVTFVTTRSLSLNAGSYTVSGVDAELQAEGQAPNLDEVLTGWIAGASGGGRLAGSVHGRIFAAAPNAGGRIGGSVQGRIRTPVTGGIS